MRLQTLFFFSLGAVASMLLGLASHASALRVGQSDGFHNPSSDGWRSGDANPNPPARIADGGPEGRGDGYLQVTATGRPGPGGNLVVFNTRQWSGDYLHQNVTAIRADLRNFGSRELVIRLLLEGPGGALLTRDSTSLPPGDGWQQATFRVRPELLVVGAGVDAEATLGRVTKLRIVHAPDLQGGGRTEGVLGVDDIRALSSCDEVGVSWPELALCRAYCDAQDCGEDSSMPACRQLARVFAARAGGPLPDADCDSVEDALDDCPGYPDPGQADFDQDGVGDACDNCPDEPNADQEETYGEPGTGDACDCPCFDRETAADLAAELSDGTRYEDLVCVDTRISQKPLSFLSAFRIDGTSCAEDSADCSLLAVVFTEDNVCQYNPPVPETAVVLQGIPDAQRAACRDYLTAAAASIGLACN